MKGRAIGRILPAVIVIVALAALYGMAMSGRPVAVVANRPPVPPRSIPVTAVERGCPGLGLAGGATGRVALIAAPATAGSGQAMATSLTATGGTPLLTATHPGQQEVARVRNGGPAPRAAQGTKPAAGHAVVSATVPGGVVVRATGAMARGLEVEQTGSSGIPSAACTSPGTDFWFTGPGQHTVGQIQLYLMNPADQAADVSVEIATDAGPVQGSTDTGIAIAPHSMVVQSLAQAVHGSRVVSLHVRTSVGQVVAAVREITGAAGAGAWLPVAQTPATRVVVPGLPAAAGSRRLFVAVPGTQDAHVTITAVTSRGSYEPTGGGGLDVPGGSAIMIDLPSLASIPAALLLKSSQPVTASMMIPGGPAGAPGVFTAAAPPLTEQGVVAVANGSSAVVLSAPRGAATVRVTELAGTAAGPAQTVRIKAGKTKLVLLTRVHGARGSSFSVVVTPLPGSGPVYAGRAIMGAGTGTVQALMPVASALTTVQLPPVRSAFISPRP